MNRELKKMYDSMSTKREIRQEIRMLNKDLKKLKKPVMEYEECLEYLKGKL